MTLGLRDGTVEIKPLQRRTGNNSDQSGCLAIMF